LDRFKDVHITTAPANIPVESFDYLRAGRRGVALQQSDGRQDHTRHAVAALHRAFLDEHVLDRMQISIPRQPLNCFNFVALDLGEFSQTGSDRIAVEQHRARAALALAAPEFRSGKIEIFPQYVEQRALRITRDTLGFPVQGELQIHIHRFSGLMFFIAAFVETSISDVSE